MELKLCTSANVLRIEDLQTYGRLCSSITGSHLLAARLHHASTRSVKFNLVAYEQILACVG